MNEFENDRQETQELQKPLSDHQEAKPRTFGVDDVLDCSVLFHGSSVEHESKVATQRETQDEAEKTSERQKEGKNEAKAAEIVAKAFETVVCPNPETTATDAKMSSLDAAIVMAPIALELVASALKNVYEATVNALESAVESIEERAQMDPESVKLDAMRNEAEKQAETYAEILRSDLINDDDGLGRGRDEDFEKYVAECKKDYADKLFEEMKRLDSEGTRNNETIEDDNVSRQERENAESKQKSEQERTAEQEQNDNEAKERQRQESDSLDRNNMPSGYRNRF